MGFSRLYCNYITSANYYSFSFHSYFCCAACDQINFCNLAMKVWFVNTFICISDRNCNA